MKADPDESKGEPVLPDSTDDVKRPTGEAEVKAEDAGPSTSKEDGEGDKPVEKFSAAVTEEEDKKLSKIVEDEGEKGRAPGERKSDSVQNKRSYRTRKSDDESSSDDDRDRSRRRRSRSRSGDRRRRRSRSRSRSRSRDNGNGNDRGGSRSPSRSPDRNDD